MAEQFVIRIQTDGQQSRTGSSGPGNSTSLNAAASAGKSLRELTPTQQQSLQNAGQTFIDSRLQELGERGIEGAAFVDLDRTQLKRKGLFSSTWDVSVTGTVYADTEMEFLSGQDSKKLENLRVFGTGHVNDFIAANQTRIAAGSVALALKGVNSLISHKQHRSGDSYYNENLNISRKAISYGMALTYGAKLGPGGLAFVAAGIAVNESINAFTEASNFKYDRMMDKEYVHNIKAVAGDISYGRRRRGDR